MTDDPNPEASTPATPPPSASPKTEAPGSEVKNAEARNTEAKDAGDDRAHRGGAKASAADVALAFATGADVAPKADGGSLDDSPDAANRERRKKKRRKKPGAPGEGQGAADDGSHPRAAGGGGQGGGRNAGASGRGGARGNASPGGRRSADDSVDADAEHLARDARTVAHNRIRPIAECSRQVRRLMATRRDRDEKEARRALVMLKSKVAYLAGREVGRERSALNKVRESIFKSVDRVVRNKDDLDHGALRSFLDQLDAFVGYHRYVSDERRRD